MELVDHVNIIFNNCTWIYTKRTTDKANK
jgi:hypothetical protein